MTWKIDPALTYTHAVSFYDEDSRSTATVKWDGCVNLEWFDSMSQDDDEGCSHHICSIDDTIASLQQLKERALMYFNETQFGIGGWPDDAAKEDAIGYIRDVERSAEK